MRVVKEPRLNISRCGMKERKRENIYRRLFFIFFIFVCLFISNRSQCSSICYVAEIGYCAPQNYIRPKNTT